MRYKILNLPLSLILDFFIFMDQTIILKNLSLIFQDPSNKRLHYVNPKHVFKGSSLERGKLLKYLGKIALNNEFVAMAITNVPLDTIKADERIFDLDLPDDVKLCHEEVNYEKSEL